MWAAVGPKCTIQHKPRILISSVFQEKQEQKFKILRKRGFKPCWIGCQTCCLGLGWNVS